MRDSRLLVQRSDGVGRLVLPAGGIPVPGGACWCKVLPCAIVFAFCVQAITGFFLWAYYSPSADGLGKRLFPANEVAGGWLLRAIHHYSAHVLLAHVDGPRRAEHPHRRRTASRGNWCSGPPWDWGSAPLAAVLTGDLLSWDQNGYAATKTRTGFLAFLPLVGPSLLKIAIGGPGPALGHLTLTRFFALHVGVFAACLRTAAGRARGFGPASRCG